MAGITIKQIAEKAKVSVGTVDRVLHNRGEVAEATKKRILAIAAEGNYKTNVFARSLKLNTSFKLAVILPNDNEYWQMQNEGILNAAEQYSSLGVSVEFFTFNRHDRNSFISESFKAMESSPQGIIMAPLLHEDALTICTNLKEIGIPFVLVDSNLAGTKPLAFIGQDSQQSGFLAAKLLNFGHENGHKCMIIRDTHFDSLNKTLDERVDGLKKYYAANKFSPDLIEEVELKKTEGELPAKLNVYFDNNEPIHLFVPNSRAHEIAKRIDIIGKKKLCRILGYDLIKENIDCLNDGLIDFIIHQNPKIQGSLAVEALYKSLILNTDVSQHQFMQLDIITKENLMYGL
ncbi:MAG: LacI family DNA-binding transcriptional regulator [Cyclobacteriaceae bacterium]